MKKLWFAIQIGLGIAIGVGCAAAGYSRNFTMLASLCLAMLLLLVNWRLHTNRTLLPRRPATKYVSPYVVTFDGEGVVVMFRDKRREAVRWADLVMVSITIEDEFLPMPYWILLGEPGKGGCVYSNDAVGAGEMLRDLQVRLPGFDNLAVARAMGMMSGGALVWQRDDWKTSNAAAGRRNG